MASVGMGSSAGSEVSGSSVGADASGSSMGTEVSGIAWVTSGASVSSDSEGAAVSVGSGSSGEGSAGAVSSGWVSSVGAAGIASAVTEVSSSSAAWASRGGIMVKSITIASRKLTVLLNCNIKNSPFHVVCIVTYLISYHVFPHNSTKKQKKQPPGGCLKYIEE